jgi:hypothetical protein
VQDLVKAACREALATGRDLIEVVAGRTEVAVDWSEMRARAERPACADALIDRVLGTSGSTPPTRTVREQGERE